MGTRRYLCGTAVLLTFMATSASAATYNEPKHHAPAPGTVNDTMSTIRDSAGHAYGTITAELTTSLKGFATEILVNDMYEVEAAQIALKRTQDPRVAEFAHKMIRAHSRNSDRLWSVLANLRDVPPRVSHLDGRRQRMLDELHGSKNADFDGRYLAQQIDAHNEALILLRRYDRSGDVRVAKRFAMDSIPAVRMHLSLARQLLNEHERRS